MALFTDNNHPNVLAVLLYYEEYYATTQLDEQYADGVENSSSKKAD